MDPSVTSMSDGEAAAGRRTEPLGAYSAIRHRGRTTGELETIEWSVYQETGLIQSIGGDPAKVEAAIPPALGLRLHRPTAPSR